jgi:hypothetical protein
MREAGCKPSACNSYLRAINSYLKWSGSRLKAPKLKEEQRVLPTFSVEDIQKIIAWKPKDHCGRRLHTIMLALADTGCRIGELLSLRWSDVDFDNLLLTVTGKGNKQRKIPFSFELRKHLVRFKHEHQLVFPTRQGRKLGRRDVLRDVKRTCRGLGVVTPERTLHAFRHTFAANYLRRGGSVYDSVTHQPVDPSRFREYMDGDKRAYVLVAGKHQFFPRRELDTIEYSIEDTYRGLYQELRGYLGKPRTTTSDPLPPELTYARYGLWRYVKIAKQKQEPYASLHRAGEILRQLRKERPEEYERIANMRDGIRAAMASPLRKGLYVFCQADRYQQLFLLDAKGEVVSKDIPKVLGAIKCGPETPIEQFPSDYNAAVMKVKRQFAEEVKHREAEREHTVSLTHGQRYVLRELRILFGGTEDEDVKAQINVLERAFRRQNLTSAVKKELNLIRRNNMVGEHLLKELVRIYQQHNIRDWVDRQRIEQERPVPRIICSEALV